MSAWATTSHARSDQLVARRETKISSVPSEDLTISLLSFSLPLVRRSGLLHNESEVDCALRDDGDQAAPAGRCRQVGAHFSESSVHFLS